MLGSAAGRSGTALAAVLGTTWATVGEWRKRFLGEGLEGRLDEPSPGAPCRSGDEDVERVVVETLESLPRPTTHWSTRLMAVKCGLSSVTVARIW